MSWKFFSKVKEARDGLSKEQAYNIIRSPVVSEKSTLLSQHNQVMFNVAMDSNKIEIKKAVEMLFEVKVDAVNTLVRKGKQRRFRGRKGQLSDCKKAIVTLADGENLDLSSGI
ncbi:MAG: 50S ribosomal protein L23 [Alphaproteobacteria bacterium]